MTLGDIRDEHTYEETRAVERLDGLLATRGVSRRTFLQLAGYGSLAAWLAACTGGSKEAAPSATVSAPPAASASPAPSASAAAPAAAAVPPVKPVPADKFFAYGSNFETRWEQLAGKGLTTPNDLFFIRSHTKTPTIDPATWNLSIEGDGVKAPLKLTYDDLRKMNMVSVTRFVECAGNARSFFDTIGGKKASGTQWKMGAVGVAKWTGVPLGAVLERAGLKPGVRDVMPWGGDDLQVRRPMPLEKAMMDDTLLVLEMNGERLPADHGFPVRVLVPNWIGVANVKWVNKIEVSTAPLYSEWNTKSYVLIGPDYKAEGQALGPVLSTQTIKSAFELPWEGAQVAAGRRTLTGRSWSGKGRITAVQVSVDDGPFQPATLSTDDSTGAWARWGFEWDAKPGKHILRARAVDSAGTTQPDRVTFNEQGYLYGGLVPHTVTVA